MRTTMEIGKPYSLSPVIDCTLFEPRMLQRLFGCQPLLGVIDKDFLKKIEKEFVERGEGDYKFLLRVSGRVNDIVEQKCTYM